MCPFQVIYGTIPRGPVALSTLPDLTRSHGDAASFVKNLAQVHSETVANLEAATAKLRVLQTNVADVWSLTLATLSGCI